MLKEKNMRKGKYRLPEISGKNQRVYGALMSYAVIFVQFLTGLLYTPLILKTLGQSEYGVYSLAVSCMGYMTIFDSGMNAAFVRFYVQTKAMFYPPFLRSTGDCCPQVCQYLSFYLAL